MGQTALEIYGQNHGDIAVVLLEMMMPMMDGPTTMRAMQQVQPDVKIIAASGLRLPESMAERAVAFLKKPYSDRELLQILTKLLQQ